MTRNAAGAAPEQAATPTESHSKLSGRPERPEWLRDRVSLTVREFARATGIPPRTVQYLIARGEISSTRAGRLSIIPIAEMEKYAQVPASREAPD